MKPKKVIKQRATHEGIIGEVCQWLNDVDDPEVYLTDLQRSGCVSGMIPGLVYYTDTVAFYERHKDEIWELLNDMAYELGHSNPIELVASFNGASNVGNDEQFKNLLAWFAFEETAYRLYRELYEEAA